MVESRSLNGPYKQTHNNIIIKLRNNIINSKVAFAVWVWSIFFTFPGTYSTQPAVTTQTFGHKHGGAIYGFLFTSDIVNNLLASANIT